MTSTPATSKLPAAWEKTPSGLLRARAIGIPFEGTPGPFNAITDVPGVEVGYSTIIEGDGPLVVGEGPVRTGVTTILPRGRGSIHVPVWAGAHSFNGNGEMTGAWWLEETGRCEMAIALTNTHSCGIVRDAVLQWGVRLGQSAFEAGGAPDWGLPVAAETFDGYLNDINGFHVTPAHVFAAMDSAAGGAVEEGSIGGGTGMICYGFKGGSGTASRRLRTGGREVTLGVFVQANFGRTYEMSIAGVPMGTALQASFETGGSGSIIVVLATDAPLLPHQLKRLARRATLGMGRTGTFGRHHSGDIFLAFSTANRGALEAEDKIVDIEFLPELELDPLFSAAVEAVDEAILNAMIANRPMTGRDGHHVRALPHDVVVAELKKAGRLKNYG